MAAVRTMLLISSLALAGLGLAGCENPRADQALAAQQSLIGMPKGILLQCAGVPARSGTESLTCQANITLKDNKVVRVIYGSADSEGERRYDQCYAIVENCLIAGSGPAH